MAITGFAKPWYWVSSANFVEKAFDFCKLEPLRKAMKWAAP